MEFLANFWQSFVAYNLNGIYAIAHFLKNNFAFFFVLCAIGYLMFQDLKKQDYNYVHDERRMI